MTFMAALQPYPLYAAPSCRESNSYAWLRPSWSCHSFPVSCTLVALPTFSTSLSSSSSSSSVSLSSSSSSSSSSSTSLSRNLGCGKCKLSEPDESAVTIKRLEPEEACRQSSIGFVPRLFWLEPLLQWTLASETRRSIMIGSLQSLSSRLLCGCLPQLSSKQFSTATKSPVFARRVALMIPLVLAASAPFNSLALNSTAEETANVGRSFLQNLGIGDGDIYYPRFFEGSWICNSTLVAVDTPQGEEKADLKSVEFSRKQLGYTVTNKARFIPFENHIIGDRLFTTQSLVESTVGRNVLDHGIWSPEQPDRLTLVLRGGLKVQNVVTKRSSSLSGPGQFDTSEYSQQIFDNNKLEGGPPTIKASQNQTRYRWDVTNDDVSYIEAFQRVSMFPVVQESLANMDILNLDKPVTVYKYIVRFMRESS